jgi:hypothetical protein
MSTDTTDTTNRSGGNGEARVLRPHQEWDRAANCPVGRDPRQLTVPALNAFGHHKRPLLRAIRENCVACAGNSQAEVRRCGMVACPFWPYRMGANPFVSRVLSLEQREQAAARLPRHRRAEAGARRKIAYSTGEQTG